MKRLKYIVPLLIVIVAMIGGMFAQVLAANYRARRRLFEVSRDRLLYPLLFSIVVFYPVWALGASSKVDPSVKTIFWPAIS